MRLLYVFVGVLERSYINTDTERHESSTFYLLSVLRFQTSYNNCIKEAGTPQQLNTNYSGPFTKYQYKYRKQK
jgi:hypothetical protein